MDGKGVGVAILDSGITVSDDLQSPGLLGVLLPRVVYKESFVGGGPATRTATARISPGSSVVTPRIRAGRGTRKRSGESLRK